MRHVFPTSEIPHKWAHQTQDSARNPQGNFSFSGKVIRSYGTDIAQLYQHKKHGTLALISEHRYSNTTAQQLNLIARAVSHIPHIYVPYPCIGRYGAGTHTADGAHALNVKFLVDRAAKELASAQRARQLRNVAWRRDWAKARLQDAQRYSAFFGIRRKVPEFPQAAWNEAAIRADRIENPDPASAGKRERERAKRAAHAGEVAEYRKEMARSIHAAGHWLPYRALKGKNWPAAIVRLIGAKGRPWYHDMAARTNWRLGEHHYHRHDPIMLRINGDEIETSAGARIPLAAAPMVWARVQRALGVGYKPAGLGVKIGDYPLTEIRPDGTLVAGCHKIPHSELRSMARALQLT